MRTNLFLAAAITMFGFVATMAFAQETLTNDDVLKLHRAGLPESVITAKIASSRGAFDTSVDALVALSEAGLPSGVIAAMTSTSAVAAPVAASAGTTPPVQQVIHGGQIVHAERATPVATAPAAFDHPDCPSPGIFLKTDEGLRELDPAAYSGVKTAGALKSAFTYGILSVKSKAMIQGTTSHNRTFDRSPTFTFCFEETESGLSYETSGATTPSQFLLVALDVNPKQNARLLVTGKRNRFTGGYAGPPPKYRAEFTYQKLARGVYEVRVNGLGPGEYCFFYTGSASATGATTYGLVSAQGGGKVFDFSVG